MPPGVGRSVFSELSRDLHAIQHAELNIPEDKIALGSAKDFRVFSRIRSLFVYTAFTDGLVVLWNTENNTETQAHRLLVLREGEEHEYHRSSFSVECQPLGSRPLSIVGAEMMATSSEAVDQVGLASRKVVFRALRNWADVEIRGSDSLPLIEAGNLADTHSD